MLQFRKTMSRLMATVRILLSLLVVGASVCRCPAQSRSAEATDPQVIVGLEGHYRIGHWTAIRLSETVDRGDRRSAAENSSIIETRDGDGTSVRYRQIAPLADGHWGYVCPGSEAAPLIIRGESDKLLSTRFPVLGSPSRGASLVPLSMPWIVAVGDTLGTELIGANELLKRDPLTAVSIPKSARGFPDSVLGYDGVDMLIMGGSSQTIVNQLNERQQRAMTDWILGGGRVLLTLGQQGTAMLKSAPWLLELLPITAEELATATYDPSALETYTSSQTPLRSFVGARLPRDRGQVLITGRTTRRVNSPLAVEYAVGFGRFHAITADLDDELFAQWPERTALITRLTGAILVPRESDSRLRSRSTAYHDLAGQLRTTMDQFAIKRSFSFSILSLIVLALIAVIGPLDYLLINRVLGRPLLGWLSVPLVVLGLSLLLWIRSAPVVANSQSEPDDSSRRCNRLEIIDLDPRAGVGRGHAISYLYTHPASRVDLDVQASETLNSISSQTQWMLTKAFGYPGESFGGIEIAIEDARLPTYQVTSGRSPDRSSDDRQSAGRLVGLPLAPRSSKGLVTQFGFAPKLIDYSVMKRRPGSQLLQGELVNPLPVDLLEAVLIYQNWVYLLPTRFRAGERIGSIDGLRQKNFRWQLSRQQALEENATLKEDWNPAMKNSLDRVAEILMFHQAAGGTRYTSLQHDPLSSLDLSHVLRDDRCLLVGQVAQPLTQLETTDSRGQQQSPTGQSLTMIRIVLPVEAETKR